MSDIRVALIEDHDLTRVGLRTALQQRDRIKVVGEAPDATRGLKLLQEVQPDVAAIDIGLPDRDGIDLTREFREFQQQTPDCQTKVLILTMHDNENTVLAAFAAGADSYCMKDISIDKLSEAIEATQEGNAWIDPAIARIVLRQAQQTRPNAPKSTPDPEPSQSQSPPIGEEEDDEIVATAPLTDRELEVLELIVTGCSNAEIADKLYITVGTVKTHVRNILNKLCADDRTQAAVRALRSGLVS
jgi:DNA-binding NarL/FixJ family response regulator